LAWNFFTSWSYSVCALVRAPAAMAASAARWRVISSICWYLAQPSPPPSGLPEAELMKVKL